MATFIDGIAASENIDSSGERIIIAGLDCSSLEKDGVFNYEHKNDQPNQVVGKILKARKIFSEKDAEDDRQLYFFKKCGVPYLYVMGELFDDYKDSAREIAGMFRYDADKKGQNERNVMNFSIEGAKIDKQGMDIPRSIARKVTITVLPCNKAAIAEMVPAAGKKPKDSLGDIFKTETGIEIELFKPAGAAELLKREPMKTNELAKADTLNPKGTKIGSTASGKDVWSHGRVGDYTGFGSADHRQAGEMHLNAGRKSGDAKLMAHHSGKSSLHMQAAGTAEKREARGVAPGPNRSPVKPSTTKPFVDIPGKNRGIIKAETAGSSNVAPSQLTGMAALAKEDILHDNIASRRKTRAEGYKAHGDMKSHAIAVAGVKDAHKQQLADLKAQPKPNLTKAGERGVHQQYNVGSNADGPGTSLVGHLARENQPGDKKVAVGEHKAKLSELKAMPKPNLTKSQALQRAEEAYAKWEKREQFEQYMAKRMPNLTKGEIKAIGQTLALQKSMVAERSLAKMAGLEKAEKPHAGMNRIGQTRSGKHIYASQKADSKHNKDFSSDDHVDAAAAHHVALINEKSDSKLKNHHFRTRNEHLNASKSTVNLKDLKAHAEKHGVHKPESHDRAAAGTAAAARISLATSSKTGFEKSENLEKSFSKVPDKFKGKAPEFKGTIDTEVEHVEPHYSSDGPDAVYLKSGHHSHGHKKGKFKVGDKVTARQHIMGTHILEHKK